MNRVNIYLDIDGVLLANERNLAIGAGEFVKFAVNNFEVYWLTTHCMRGDASRAVDVVQRASDEDLRPYLEQIRPTSWNLNKTEAIDFSKPFLWFDDDCYSREEAVLKQHNAYDSWIEIDLYNHPNQLVHELKLLKSLVTGSERLNID